MSVASSLDDHVILTPVSVMMSVAMVEENDDMSVLSALNVEISIK